MTHPRYALHNISAASYANLPSSANATFSAFTESEADCTTGTLLGNDSVRAPAVALGGTPSPTASTFARASFSDNETQTLTTKEALSPASSECFGSLFGGESDDEDGDEGEAETPGVTAVPSDVEGLSSNFEVTSEFLGDTRVGTSHNPLPTLLKDERHLPTTSYSSPGFDEGGRQKLYNLEVTPQSLDPATYYHNDHPSRNQYQYQEWDHSTASIVMPMVPALPSIGTYVYNTLATQPAYGSPRYPTNAIQPYHPSAGVVTGSSYEDTNAHSSSLSCAAAEVPFLSAKTAGKRRAERTPSPEPTAPSQEFYSTDFTPTAESWHSTIPPPSSGSQGLNKRKRGDDDKIDEQMRRPAPSHEGIPFTEPSTYNQDSYRFTESEHGFHIVDLRNHQSDFCQGGQQQVSTNNLASVETPTAPVPRGDPSLIGFSKQELELWLEATEAYYQYPLQGDEEVYMLVRPLIVTTRQLVGAFSEFPWPGQEAYHIYRGFNWYPIPPGMECINSYLGIRVGVFQNSGTSEYRYIPLDIERNPYTTIDEFYYHLMRVNDGAYWIHSRRLVDVTHLSGGLSANKPFRGAIPRKP